MVTSERIKQRTGDPVTDLGLDTIVQDKQLLVFVNTKRSAEACSDRIAEGVRKKLPIATRHKLGQELKNVLSSPTEQCKRLGNAAKNQVAFHHSGLHSEQRSLIEAAFKQGHIRVICATPTLAAGLDMPAYRVVIRDLQRFSGGWGMQPIPVLEYEQMSGRAGRPSYDDEGQAITVAEDQDEVRAIREDYIEAEPEPIQSKLAARPVLRTYMLSLVATQYVNSMEELQSFMKETFYAHQYGDDDELNRILHQVKDNLVDWDMIDDGREDDEIGFVSAKDLQENDVLEATDLGRRVSELYLDPYTANNLVNRLLEASDDPTPFALLHAVSDTLEMRPLIRVKKGDKQPVESALLKNEEDLLVEIPDQFEDEYNEFLNGVKTTIVLHEWINEVSENRLNDKYGVTPGELQAKRSLADWLLYSCDELCNILERRDLATTVKRVRRRVNLGVSDDLLNLTRLDGIGRVRSRKLYDAGVTSVGDVKDTSYDKLKSVLGPKTAASIKEQTGTSIDPSTVDEEHHGNLLDYSRD